MTQQQWEGQVVPLTPHGATSTCPLRFQVLWKATFDSDTQVCSHRTLGFILLDHCLMAWQLRAIYVSYIALS